MSFVSRFARRLVLPISALALLVAVAPPVLSETPAHWVGTWGAALVPTPNKDNVFSAPTTLRQTIHVSLGGSRLRLVFSNEFGTDPLAIGGARLALGRTGDSLPVTFNAQPSATIPPGAVLLSDALTLPLAPLSDLTITLFLPGQTVHTVTRHGSAYATNQLAEGDQLAAPALTHAHPVTSWYFLKSVDVEAAPNAGSIACFGDSITDGAKSTPDANHRWPDVLAARLAAAHLPLAVLNEGIGGNRVLHDGTGPNALARFDRDVLDQPGLHAVIVMEGINDIGTTAGPDQVTAQQIIDGLTQLILRAHAHGVRILGATLTPYQGAAYATPAGEAKRQAVNAFIRAPGHFDAVLDFDRATADPAQPLAFQPAFDSGDHLHPSDAGYRAMGDSIELKLLTR